MRRLFYATALGISLASSLSCVHSPPDIPICIEEDMFSGFCVRAVSGQEFTIDDKHPYSPFPDQPAKTWIDIRPYMILMPIQSWVELKTFILNICKTSGQCSEAVANWERSVNAIDSKTTAKGGS